MLLSHLRAGSGAVAVTSNEENRLLNEALAELGGVGREFAVTSAPNGPVFGVRLVHGRAVRDREPVIRAEPGKPSLVTAYEWAAASPGRVLFCLDWHMLANAPGHWRLLIDALPGIRRPKGCGAEDPPSLVVFVSPTLTLEPFNPLRGQIPVLAFDPPSREALRIVAGGIADLPPDGEGEAVVDALCGLSADSAEQVCAETIARGNGWDSEVLRAARRQAIKEGGLEIWSTTPELGGLGRFQGFVESELIPWLRDPQLAVKRILLAGLPGTGKSFSARWLAHRLGCECARISIPNLKAGVVGASEANLKRCLRTVDAMAKHSPLVVIVDEIDTIARDGLDGGTSSGMFAELLTWLQESESQAIVMGTLNELSKLDAALESRFSTKFLVDLPSIGERESVAAIHFGRLGCKGVSHAAKLVAANTDGFSNREIAEIVCPSAARLSNRELDDDTIRLVVKRTVPASVTQAVQLEAMRRAASTLRKANDEDEARDPSPTRKVMG